MTVLPPFPNLLGTWSGTLVVKTGFGKGSRAIQTEVITSESQSTGAFTTDGTDFINGVTLAFDSAGAITTKGVYQSSGTDVPLDAAGTIIAKGKLVGTKLIGTYKDALNTGTVTLVRIAL